MAKHERSILKGLDPDRLGQNDGQTVHFHYPLVNWHSYSKRPIYSGFSHWKWWFSIVMLVYQRVLNHNVWSVFCSRLDHGCFDEILVTQNGTRKIFFQNRRNSALLLKKKLVKMVVPTISGGFLLLFLAAATGVQGDVQPFPHHGHLLPYQGVLDSRSDILVDFYVPTTFQVQIHWLVWCRWWTI